jgi:hypothetical protein
LKPGDFLIGTPRYNGRFKSEFIKSLQNPIVINPDDSEKTKQLKQAMIDTKKELSDAINRGEDIEQIMLNTRSELQDLMLYKMKMKQQFNELRKECKTNEDVELYLEACNKMLEEKGIAPIQLGPISKRNLILSN